MKFSFLLVAAASILFISHEWALGLSPLQISRLEELCHARMGKAERANGRGPIARSLESQMSQLFQAAAGRCRRNQRQIDGWSDKEARMVWNEELLLQRPLFRCYHSIWMMMVIDRSSLHTSVRPGKNLIHSKLSPSP